MHPTATRAGFALGEGSTAAVEMCFAANMAIVVRQTGSGDPMEFDVEVRESGGQTRHRVTMSQATYTTLASGRAEPSACIQAAFAFLLDREPKESILARFDVTVIGRYFPEFEREIGRYLG